MNKGLIKSNYITWLLSDKQIMTAVSLMFLYMYTIMPLIEFAAIFNEPLGLFESYMTFLGNGYCMPIFIIALLITIIDFPDLNSNAGFVLMRTGRKKWYANQILFLFMAIITYMVILFVFSIIFTAGISFILNGWSNVTHNLQLSVNEDLKNKYPLATVDLSIINNFRPYAALVYSIILMVLQLLFHGQLQVFLTIRFNRIVGICSSIGVLGIGLALWASSSNLKWIFPLANSTIGWHYGKLYRETTFPLWISFAYFIVVNLVLYVLGQRNVKNKQFYLEANVDDQD